jgi:hypothetical protein
VKLDAEEAERAARVIEEMFADIEDLREFARHHDAEHLGTRTRESHARVTLFNLMSYATDGDLYGEDDVEEADGSDSVHRPGDLRAEDPDERGEAGP